MLDGQVDRGKLPKANFIIFGRDLFDDDSMDFGKFGCVILSEDDSDLNMPGRETYVLNEDASGVKARFHLAQTVPVATGNIELDTEKDEDGDKALHIDQSLSFTTLADMATGDKRIGVLKMDVDNLGFIFSIGLEAPENLKNQGSLRSISRLSTLSRQITAFLRCTSMPFAELFSKGGKASQTITGNLKMKFQIFFI